MFILYCPLYRRVLLFTANFKFMQWFRIYLPRRILTPSNCGTFGVSDYPELGTRFKAAHVKTMCWWVGYKLEELSRESESYMHSLHSSFFRYL